MADWRDASSDVIIDYLATSVTNHTGQGIEVSLDWALTWVIGSSLHLMSGDVTACCCQHLIQVLSQVELQLVALSRSSASHPDTLYF